MMQLSLVISVIMLIASQSAYSKVRLSGGFGLGSTTTSNEVSDSEGPLTQLYTVENVFSSNLLGGVEHLRSLQLSPPSTAVAFTGVFSQYYFSAIPTPYLKPIDAPTDKIIYRDLGYFAGVGFGLVQSSRVADENGKSSNAAGLYISPRFGVDVQLTKSFGLRSSIVFGFLIVGKGAISSASLAETLYFSF